MVSRFTHSDHSRKKMPAINAGILFWRYRTLTQSTRQPYHMGKELIK